VCKRLLSQLCVCICWQQTAVYRRLLQWQYKMNFRERTDIILSARDIAFQQVGCRGGGDPYSHDTAHLAGIGLGLAVLDI
jgi:hypothetical protein